ncbi:uncharacterized protein LOC110456209 [Mizuhopecten yessoensis]|uniref:uncharacterized protein LOC110456209 n=1 Tax=Mizuhopecten yessoensis TaxID=6573 RepID=UPI000B457F10|nr:uncharacterized protein LOC110456209 [Mizuhopecten yessoensis]
MALVTYTAPSGFSTDIERVTGVARKETNGKTVTLYINNLQMDRKQLRLQSFRTQDVADVKNGVVSVEMYYNPVASKTVTYDLPDAVKLTACQLSGDMDDACPKPRNPNGASSATPTKLLLTIVSTLMLMTNLN